ncbi:MAG: hypothetical protein ACLQPD_17705, partial [Desulfomonilaceae bacterium]
VPHMPSGSNPFTTAPKSVSKKPRKAQSIPLPPVLPGLFEKLHISTLSSLYYDVSSISELYED